MWVEIIFRGTYPFLEMKSYKVKRIKKLKGKTKAESKYKFIIYSLRPVHSQGVTIK